MPVPRGLRSFLKDHKIKYRTLIHPSTYTAQQLAHSQHISGEDVLKVVLLREDKGFVMAIMPASYKADFMGLKKALGTKQVRLATESEMKQIFPDCEIGAMPPIGELYKLNTLADESLTKKGDVIFNAGTHREAMRVKYQDLAKWVKPKVGKIAKHL